MTPAHLPKPSEVFADTPRQYRVPVLRALIAIERMRVALYSENPADDPCAELRAIEARERAGQLAELLDLIQRARAIAG